MAIDTSVSSNALYFIAADLSDLETLLAGLPAEAEVHLLDAEADGLAQMLAALAGRAGLSAIHVVTHGASGRVDLGSLALDGAALETRAEDLAALGQYLNEEGDILLYGCNVAEGESGAAFVARLAELTGADVAASTDFTGAAALANCSR
jgi:large repetitive protein